MSVSFPPATTFLSDLVFQETSPVIEIFQYLANITEEPSSLPPSEHAVAHTLNATSFERKFSYSYLSPKGSREAVNLRKQTPCTRFDLSNFELPL